MLSKKRIGILGAGHMAAALVRGLSSMKGASVAASHHHREKAEVFSKTHGIPVLLDNRDLVQKSDVVILAVKPQALPKVLGEIAPALTKSHLVISIAAGIPLSWIRSKLKKPVILRAMPNLPATIQEGVTAIASEGKVSFGRKDRAS